MSRLTTILFVMELEKLKVLESSSLLKKIILIALLSNLRLFSDEACTKNSEPKT